MFPVVPRVFGLLLGRATVRAVRLAAPLPIDGALDEALYNGPSISGFVQVSAKTTSDRSSRRKVADLVALDRDYLTVPADQIKDVKPVQTFVGGRIVYNSEAVAASR